MSTTVTDKGQVTLPKKVRDQLGIVPGTRLQFEAMPDGTLRAQLLPRGSDGLFGLLARPGETARSLDDIDAGIAAAVAERTTRRKT